MSVSAEPAAGARVGAWHEETFMRILGGIEQRITQICERHFVSQDFILEGIWDWFRTEHAELNRKYQAMEDRIDLLWLEGRTDAEAQKQFNDALRSYRDATFWILERHASWKKDREAADRAAQADPAQGKLTI